MYSIVKLELDRVRNLSGNNKISFDRLCTKKLLWLLTGLYTTLFWLSKVLEVHSFILRTYKAPFKKLPRSSLPTQPQPRKKYLWDM